ncbi:bactofilin family protein [Sphingosinicella terrae]|jgi:cytoskeletal protein CcmA (bactofilin family)|uniref:bactofilin family protein n=1 Tax=Sphingosinicella terrae TaxID=2172047 RepID=UPI000E0CE731|nr:polymer-forming cytoskeletal protein [Sphingosinicella terrae]
MFSRKSSHAKGASRPPRSGAPGLSFVGTEVVISGDVSTSAQLHVDGRIDGGVRCGHLFQGADGLIAGDIVADEARIAGQVQGTVNARNVVVEATGCVSGDIAYETISIAAGARIDGRLARREALSAGSDTLIALPAEPAKASTIHVAPGLFASSGHAAAG